jgi:outer membrane receptor protein involved in Fe transport
MLRKAAVALCIAATGRPAGAAEDYPYYYKLEPPTEERYAGGEAVTGGGYVPVFAREFAGTARVLDGEFLRSRGYLWLGQVLAEEAGIYVEYVPGREGPTMTPRFRGATGREVLLLVDGVPVNDLATGWADLKVFPIEGVSRVEVIQGPASFRFGDRAVAGVVNVETMKGPRESARALISASDGSFDTERYRFNFGMTARRIDLFASGNRIITNEPNGGDRNTSANVDGRVARRWGNVGELDLVYGHYTNSERVLHPWTWEEIQLSFDDPKAPGLQKGWHDRMRLAARRRWGAGELGTRGYYVTTRSWFHDAEERRLYQTRAYEEGGDVWYTLPHAGGAVTLGGGGGLRGEADANERAALVSGRLLEELRPADGVYLAGGASYDALAGVGGALSPRLAASALLARAVKFYGSLSGGVRLPAAAELGRREEVTRELGYEVGTRFYKKGVAEVGVAHFYGRGKDVYLDGEGKWTAELTRRGVEGAAEGALPPCFDWGASYCLTDAARADGEEAGFIPKHRAFGKFGLKKGFLKDDLTLRAEARLEYTGARRNVAPEAPGYVVEPYPYFKIPYRYELPAYWQAGAHLSVAVVSFRVYCNLENINRARDYVIRPGYSVPRRMRTYVGFNWTLFD